MIKAVSKAIASLALLVSPWNQMRSTITFFTAACLCSSIVSSTLTFATDHAHKEELVRGQAIIDAGLQNTPKIRASDRNRGLSGPFIFSFAPDPMYDIELTWKLLNAVNTTSLIGTFGQDAGSVTWSIDVTKVESFKNYVVIGTATFPLLCGSQGYTAMSFDLELDGAPVAATSASSACSTQGSYSYCNFEFTNLPDFHVPPNKITAWVEDSTADSIPYRVSVTQPSISFSNQVKGAPFVYLECSHLTSLNRQLDNSYNNQVPETLKCPANASLYTESTNYQHKMIVENTAKVTANVNGFVVDQSESAVVTVSCSAIPPNIQISNIAKSGSLMGTFNISNTSGGTSTSVILGATKVTIFGVSSTGVRTNRGICGAVTSTGATIPPGGTAVFSFSSCVDNNNKAFKYDKNTYVEISINGPSTRNEGGVVGRSVGWSAAAKL